MLMMVANLKIKHTSSSSVTNQSAFGTYFKLLYNILNNVGGSKFRGFLDNCYISTRCGTDILWFLKRQDQGK